MDSIELSLVLFLNRLNIEQFKIQDSFKQDEVTLELNKNNISRVDIFDRVQQMDSINIFVSSFVPESSTYRTARV